MYKLTHKDSGCLLSILDSIDKILSYTKKFKSADEFYSDTISCDATMMNFIVIGEMAEKLSDEFRSVTESEIDWYKIKGFRNIIAHNYFSIVKSGRLFRIVSSICRLVLKGLPIHKVYLIEFGNLPN